LLQEDVGEFRHRKLAGEHHSQTVSKINGNINVSDMERHEITIPRGHKQFGFSVVGEYPTFIGRVDQDSSAAMCGLKSGDYIVKINGKNVSRAQKNTVSNLIKNSKKTVSLDIYRPSSSTTLSGGGSATTSNHDLASWLSSTGTATESSTCSESSAYGTDQNYYRSLAPPPPPPPALHNHRLKQLLPQEQQRRFVNLEQLGHYVEPTPLLKGIQTTQTIYETNNSSMLACKGSPTQTLV